MKKLIWGIVLVSLGGMALIGLVTNRDRPPNVAGPPVLCLLMLAGGVTLIAFAQREANAARP